MKRILFALAFAMPPAIAPVAFAADGPQAPGSAEQRLTPEQRRQQWEAMTPEQRQAKRQEMRQRHEKNMTPEQRARREARRQQWEAMTPEQREAKRQEMRQRRGTWQGRR